jgi:hypothetical protein
VKRALTPRSSASRPRAPPARPVSVRPHQAPGADQEVLGLASREGPALRASRCAVRCLRCRAAMEVPWKSSRWKSSNSPVPTPSRGREGRGRALDPREGRRTRRRARMMASCAHTCSRQWPCG